MPAIPVRQASRRHCVRRAVDLSCAVRGELWNGPLPLQARDLSPEGLWLSSAFALDPGSQLVLSFRPPRWPVGCFPVVALGEVVRVDLHRRRTDARPSGLGVRFVDIESDDQDRMYRALRGLPPPLPPRARPEPLARVDAETSFALDDGQVITFRSIGLMLALGKPDVESALDALALPSALRLAC